MSPVLSRPAMVALTCTWLAADCLADGDPDSFELHGIVRDFHDDHEDFDVNPVDGFGHYAGNVALTLDSGGRPVFGGGGIKVNNQWRNGAGQPIAPHLFVSGGGGGTVKVVLPPDIHGNATVDTWDSSLGPYDEQTPGPPPTFEVGATMPALIEPAGLGPSTGNVTWGDETITGDLHCDDLTVNGDAVITGHRTVLVDGEFTMATQATMTLAAGASVDFYVHGDVTVMPLVNLNGNTGLPGLVTINYMGTEEIRVSQPNGVVYATVVAPNAKMRMMPNDIFFGMFTGHEIEIKANAAFHADTAGSVVFQMCGAALNDTAGSVWVVSDGAITSADTYAQWYRDILGINVSRPYSITLNRNGDVYEYIDDAFHPLDGDGFGNEGDAHNNFFTYAVDADFTYEACAGQFVELLSFDDSWLFINGLMVIDRGGVGADVEQVIELDRLNLVDGESYELRLFFAHRHDATPRLHIRTNIALEDEPDVVTISAFYD